MVLATRCTSTTIIHICQPTQVENRRGLPATFAVDSDFDDNAVPFFLPNLTPTRAHFAKYHYAAESTVLKAE